MPSENYVIRDQNAVHFITFTVMHWIDVFTRANYKNEIIDSLSYCQKHKGLVLYSYCLMTNHLHLVCKVVEPFGLSDFVRDFKKYTAKKILKKIWDEDESRRDWLLKAFREAEKYDNRIKEFRFWQGGCHPIQLVTNSMLYERICYVHENPVKAGIVVHSEDYLYSSARNYASLRGMVDVEVLSL